jgi:hypothetical protein
MMPRGIAVFVLTTYSGYGVVVVPILTYEEVRPPLNCVRVEVAFPVRPNGYAKLEPTPPLIAPQDTTPPALVVRALEPEQEGMLLIVRLVVEARPETVRRAVGLVVPIPTFPACVTMKS